MSNANPSSNASYTAKEIDTLLQNKEIGIAAGVLKDTVQIEKLSSFLQNILALETQRKINFPILLPVQIGESGKNPHFISLVIGAPRHSTNPLREVIVLDSHGKESQNFDKISAVISGVFGNGNVNFIRNLHQQQSLDNSIDSGAYAVENGHLARSEYHKICLKGAGKISAEKGGLRTEFLDGLLTKKIPDISVIRSAHNKPLAVAPEAIKRERSSSLDNFRTSVLSRGDTDRSIRSNGNAIDRLVGEGGRPRDLSSSSSGQSHSPQSRSVTPVSAEEGSPESKTSSVSISSSSTSTSSSKSWEEEKEVLKFKPYTEGVGKDFVNKIRGEKPEKNDPLRKTRRGAGSIFKDSKKSFTELAREVVLGSNKSRSR